MKIIGESRDRVILDASKDEIAHLIGYSYASHGEASRKIVVGATIEISAMYHQLVTLDRRKDSIKEAQAVLRGLADALAPVQPLIYPEEVA